MRASSAGLVLNFARLRRANFYRFTQGLHSCALLPFYAKTSSLLPNPHPMEKGIMPIHGHDCIMIMPLGP
jgi:hypothetical protein